MAQGVDGRPALDPEVIETLRSLGAGVGEDTIAKLSEMFFEDFPPRLAALRRSVLEGDMEEAVKTSHYLKGAAHALGATVLAEILVEEESLARSSEASRCAELLDPLEAEHRRVAEAFREILGGS